MSTSQDQRKKYWTYVFAWGVCIYSTLYIVRPICEFLKKTTPFSFLTNLLMVLLLAFLVIYLCIKIRIKSPLTYFLLTIAVSFYIYGLTKISYPEEKIHFIEYGFLAYLIYKALRIDLNKSFTHIGAFLLTSTFGWVDEGIQHLLPNRYYQIEDIFLNSLSGALGLFLVFIFARGNPRM